MANVNYSKPVQAIVEIALLEAKEFLKEKEAEEIDIELLQLLSQQGSSALHGIAVYLGLSSNYHGRISEGQCIGGDKYLTNLIDCWEVFIYSAKFTEQSLLPALKNISPADIFEQTQARWVPSDIHHLAFVLWKLYAAGHDRHLNEMAPYFELFDLRQDLTSLELSDAELEPYEISVCVTLLLARDNAEPAAVEKLLGQIPIFAGVADFWEDDSGFAQFTERAAQWHFEYSVKNSALPARFADVATDQLVPSWIFALDQFRQKHLKRASALGNHELLTFGRNLFSDARTCTYPRLDVLTLAERRYVELFGRSAFNPLPIWGKFLLE